MVSFGAHPRVPFSTSSTHAYIQHLTFIYLFHWATDWLIFSFACYLSAQPPDPVGLQFYCSISYCSIGQRKQFTSRISAELAKITKKNNSKHSTMAFHHQCRKTTTAARDMEINVLYITNLPRKFFLSIQQNVDFMSTDDTRWRQLSIDKTATINLRHISARFSRDCITPFLMKITSSELNLVMI